MEIAQRPLRSRGTGSEAGAIVVKYDLEAETVSRLPRPEGAFTDPSFHVIVFTWHSVHRVFLGEDAIVGIGESEGRRHLTDEGRKFIIHNVSGSSTEAEERTRAKGETASYVPWNEERTTMPSKYLANDVGRTVTFSESSNRDWKFLKILANFLEL